MGQRHQYRSTVSYTLINKYDWHPHVAKVFVRKHQEDIENLRLIGISARQVAKTIIEALKKELK